MRKALSLVVAPLAAMLLAAPAATATASRSGPPSATTPHRLTGHVVLVGWDGFDPKYLSTTATPNLSTLAKRGRLTQATGTFPTISNPSWTTVATGAWPQVHGNVAYSFDRTTNKAVGQTRVMNAQSIADVIGQAGGTFASVNWYIVQNHGAVYGDPKHLYVQASGACTARTDAALDLIAHRPVKSGSTTVTVDTMPDMLALYCDDLDALGHAEGAESPKMPATLASLDAQLGRLIQGLKDAGVYDDTTFVLTGDHGMRTFTHGFGQSVLDALTTAGYHPQFLDPGASPAPGTDVVMTVGGVANVYLLGARRTPTDIAKVRSVLAGVRHVRHVYGQAALNALHGGAALGDLVAEPEVGWSFSVGDPAGPSGYHGLIDVIYPGFLIAGKSIRPNARPDNPRLVDIAPTISTLLGIPAPAQAQGRALTETFRKRH